MGEMCIIHPFLDHMDCWLANDYFEERFVTYSENGFWNGLRRIGIYSDEQLHFEIRKNENRVYRELSACCLDYKNQNDMVDILKCIYKMTEQTYPIEETESTQQQMLAKKLNHIFERQTNALCEDEEQIYEELEDVNLTKEQRSESLTEPSIIIDLHSQPSDSLEHGQISLLKPEIDNDEAEKLKAECCVIL